MKRFILLTLLFFSVSAGFAQSNLNKAEVFLQINNRGKYLVELDDESVASKTGRFRFYDVYNSEPLLTISLADKIIFKRRVNVRPGQRLILDFSRGQIKTLNQITLNTYQDDFFGNDKLIDQQPIYVNDRLMSSEVLNEFYELYKKEAFDDGRAKLILAKSKTSMFSSEQAKYLLKSFSFDDERLKTAKFLYKSIVDPQNYILVANTFTYLSNKQDFLDFLANTTNKWLEL